jgi:hypothetical protein
MNSGWVILPVFSAPKVPAWQVGHYGPHDNFVQLGDDYSDLAAAEANVHYLNGGTPEDQMDYLTRQLELINANLRNIR